MARKPKDPKNGPQLIMYKPRPVDREVLDFLRSKSTMSTSNIIREALAYRAESMGLNLLELMERLERNLKQELELKLERQLQEAKEEYARSTPA